MEFADIIFVWHLEDEAQLAWHGRRHSHGPALHEIHYFISGTGSFMDDRRRWTIAPGALHLTAPSSIHQIVASDARRPLTYYAVLFDTAQDGELLELLESLGRSPGPWNIGSSRRFFFAELLERFFSGREGPARSARHQFMAFLWDLADGASPHRDAIADANIEKSLAIMQGAIDRDLDLGDLASRVGLSREHLVRTFSARMGMSPMKYYSRLKVEAARAMLSSTNLRVNEIADRLRYSSRFNFARAFRRLAGMSPSEYRARHLQRADFAATPDDIEPRRS
jgi:AraC-like DNA-binding protein